MGILFHSANIDVHIMNYDDIPFICRADGDESQHNISYLKRQLENQEKGNVLHYLHCTTVLSQDMYFYITNADGEDCPMSLT